MYSINTTLPLSSQAYRTAYMYAAAHARQSMFERACFLGTCMYVASEMLSLVVLRSAI